MCGYALPMGIPDEQVEKVQAALVTLFRALIPAGTRSPRKNSLKRVWKVPGYYLDWTPKGFIPNQETIEDFVVTEIGAALLLAPIVVCPAHRCGKEFVRERPNLVYCSKKCGNRTRVRRSRGKEAPPLDETTDIVELVRG
jgi:hypothetical protein